MTRPVALVTGGARRVGRAIAAALAEVGHDLVIHYRTSAEDAERTAAELRVHGGRVETVRSDLSRVAEIEGLLGTTAELFGRLDLLVNNASTFRRVPFGEVTEADFAELVDANLKGPFFCAQFAAPLMQEEGGQIINLLDRAVHRPVGDYLAYRAAKVGLAALTEDLARTLAPGIRVNGVAPGPVLVPEHYGRRARERAARETLLGRLGHPEDVARAVVFLATGPGYLTGTILDVDGGRRLGG
jgi:pteridine reductase